MRAYFLIPTCMHLSKDLQRVGVMSSYKLLTETRLSDGKRDGKGVILKHTCERHTGSGQSPHMSPKN